MRSFCRLTVYRDTDPGTIRGLDPDPVFFLLVELVNPQLDLEVYLMVQTTTQEMLDHIDKHQRNKLKGDLADLPKQPECLKLRTERGLETMAIPNLVIRRPSVVQVSIALYIINTERVKRDRFS